MVKQTSQHSRQSRIARKNRTILLNKIRQQVKSGNYQMASEAVNTVRNTKDPELYSDLLGQTYIDKRGVLWATPDFVMSPARQNVVDFALWQLLALAPDETWAALPHRREEITKITLRAYSSELVEPGAHYRVIDTIDPGSHRMKCFPDEIWRFPALQELDCSATSFETIPSAIGRCTGLRSLTIHASEADKLPESIGKLVNLEHLNLACNQLDSLPTGFSRLMKLKSLDLSYNSFRFVPSVIGQLSGLEKLNLKGNEITKLPESFFSCKGMRHLSLGENQIQKIDPKINKLTKLEVLQLEANKQLGELMFTLPMLNQISLVSCTCLPLAMQRVFSGKAELAIFHQLRSGLKNWSIRRTLSKPAKAKQTLSEDDELICSMLRSSDANHFSTGLMLLFGSGDPELADRCLSTLPVTHSNDENLISGPILNLPQHLIKTLLEFLTKTDFPKISTPDAWQNGIRGINIQHDQEILDLLPLALPKLDYLRISCSALDSPLNTEHIKNINTVALNNYWNSELRFGHSFQGCSILILEGCQLSESLQLSGCADLQEIKMSDSYVRNFEINNCPSLEKISQKEPRWMLSSKSVTVAISSTPRLSKLDLPGWHIRKLDISGSPALNFISLSGRLPASRSQHIEHTGNILHVRLRKGMISKLPDWIYRCTELAILDLAGNYMQTIHDRIASLVNLKSLDLSGNRMQTVPYQIGKLTSLEKLNLQNNQIQVLPEALFNCSQLQLLNISQNNISCIGPEINKLTRLKSLDAQNNRNLEKIDFDLPALDHISLEKCFRMPAKIQKEFSGRTKILQFKKVISEIREESKKKKGKDAEDSVYSNIDLITGMLRSVDPVKFSTGLKHLKESGDPDLANECLSVLPAMRPTNDQSVKHPVLTLPHQLTKLLVEFLSEPSFPNRGADNAWQNTILGISIPDDQHTLDLLSIAFPRVNQLRIMCTAGPLSIDLRSVRNMETVVLCRYQFHELLIEMNLTGCRRLILENCETSGSFRMQGCPEIREFQMIDSFFRRFEISDCPKIEIIEQKNHGRMISTKSAAVIINSMPQLTKINLPGWHIASLDVTGSPALAFIWLCGKLPSVKSMRIEHTESLLQIRLERGKLSKLPDWLLQCSGVETLDLSSNHLYTLPDEIAGLENLQHLNLSGNLMSGVPASLKFLGQLKSLDLGWQTKRKMRTTSLQELDSTLSLLPSLEKVTVKMSEIKLRRYAYLLAGVRGYFV